MSTPRARTSTGRCGAYETPSTTTRAEGDGPARTSAAMEAMGWMLPRILLAWVQVTRRVRDVRRGARLEGWS